ncbi:flagellar assembly protein H [[Flavobacterium] thermophilum]|nr:flagellar assembly protein H [Geobacillus sp. 12AMOR1]STO13429.1 flagellar assembly protein H [[Flavobacterium] thermophilum]
METKEAKQVMELIISYEQRGIEKGIQQGVKQGIEQGLKQGIKQGMKQGIEQGRQKGIEEGKIDIAKKMLAKGYDVDTVHELTGLPAEKIEQLKK